MKPYREFADSSGTVWRVYRVEPQSVSASLARLRESMASVESERRQPWLLFESSVGDRRRLAPVPARWDENCTDAELANWSAAADSIPPAPARRAGEDDARGDQSPPM
jgi:hypothetical protein